MARLAEGAARRLGLSEPDATSIRRAAYLHDLGRMGVPIAVWNATDTWSSSDRERAMRHPLLTELVLARSTTLGPLGTLAGLHHERLDGAGYRAVPGSFQLVADVWNRGDYDRLPQFVDQSYVGHRQLGAIPTPASA